MKITFGTDVLFSITSKEEEKMLQSLHDYLDYMYFAN
jgi:phosphotransferase system HPr-like phosphotransfer protein